MKSLLALTTLWLASTAFAQPGSPSDRPVPPAVRQPYQRSTSCSVNPTSVYYQDSNLRIVRFRDYGGRSARWVNR